MLSTDKVSHAQAILVITAVWSGWLGVLALLGWLGQGTGLAVWPMGEDRNWIALLQQDTAVATARAFWQIDYRNPVSPWWYLLFKPLIVKHDYGLFALRSVISLALALSTYALITTIAGPKARRFAAVVGCIICLWTFNAYFDQIYWNFLAALGCSILCVTCFALHLQRRGNGQWLAASLVLWLLAVSTYTIQTGAAAAIAMLAFAVGSREARGGLLLRAVAGIRTAVEATWPFAAILLVFLLIWRTTASPSDAFVTAPSLDRLLASLRMGLWHEDFDLMGAILAQSPHRTAYGITGLLVGGLAMIAVRQVELPRPDPLALTLIIVVTGCIAIPTVMVETLGAQWTPGRDGG